MLQHILTIVVREIIHACILRIVKYLFSVRLPFKKRVNFVIISDFFNFFFMEEKPWDFIFVS